ncbi:hypothetical protein C8R43DRAFT_1128041 [Mycena crocata]|nr:hypothetical protein C8R43DRAFT_1128041 [Mycena crocata]
MHTCGDWRDFVLPSKDDIAAVPAMWANIFIGPPHTWGSPFEPMRPRTLRKQIRLARQEPLQIAILLPSQPAPTINTTINTMWNAIFSRTQHGAQHSDPKTLRALHILYQNNPLGSYAYRIVREATTLLTLPSTLVASIEPVKAESPFSDPNSTSSITFRKRCRETLINVENIKQPPEIVQCAFAMRKDVQALLWGIGCLTPTGPTGVREFPNLKSLIIDDIRSFPPCYAPALHELVVRSQTWLTNDNLSSMLGTTSTLESLRILDLLQARITNVDLSAILGRCPDLAVLRIPSGCYDEVRTGIIWSIANRVESQYAGHSHHPLRSVELSQEPSRSKEAQLRAYRYLQGLGRAETSRRISFFQTPYRLKVKHCTDNLPRSATAVRRIRNDNGLDQTLISVTAWDRFHRRVDGPYSHSLTSYIMFIITDFDAAVQCERNGIRFNGGRKDARLLPPFDATDVISINHSDDEDATRINTARLATTMEEQDERPCAPALAEELEPIIVDEQEVPSRAPTPPPLIEEPEPIIVDEQEVPRVHHSPPLIEELEPIIVDEQEVPSRAPTPPSLSKEVETMNEEKAVPSRVPTPPSLAEAESITVDEQKVASCAPTPSSLAQEAEAMIEDGQEVPSRVPTTPSLAVELALRASEPEVLERELSPHPATMEVDVPAPNSVITSSRMSMEVDEPAPSQSVEPLGAPEPAQLLSCRSAPTQIEAETGELVVPMEVDGGEQPSANVLTLSAFPVTPGTYEFLEEVEGLFLTNNPTAMARDPSNKRMWVLFATTSDAAAARAIFKGRFPTIEVAFNTEFGFYQAFFNAADTWKLETTNPRPSHRSNEKTLPTGPWASGQTRKTPPTAPRASGQTRKTPPTAPRASGQTGKTPPTAPRANRQSG